MTDVTFNWATVTGIGPLQIRLDGDTAPLAVVPDSIVDPLTLTVGDRVRVESSQLKIIVHGVSGGVSSVMPGQVVATAASTAPVGWLLCNGQSVLRATYPALFAAIGTTYGSVDGTHFTVPSMVGKVVVGAGTGFTLGATGGEQTHTLTTGEIPAHNHQADGPVSFLTNGTGGSNASISDVTGSRYRIVSNTTTVGGGGAHNNMQPYIALNWVIKT